LGFLAIYHQHAGVDGGSLMQRCPDGAVQTVFQVQGSPVLHHMGKKITEKRGVLRQEGLKVQSPFGGH
jgi:hypothetical protein